MANTFGAEFLARIQESEYGCGCGDPVTPRFPITPTPWGPEGPIGIDPIGIFTDTAVWS